jgi:hypothetical protein
MSNEFQGRVRIVNHGKVILPTPPNERELLEVRLAELREQDAEALRVADRRFADEAELPLLLQRCQDDVEQLEADIVKFKEERRQLLSQASLLNKLSIEAGRRHEKLYRICQRLDRLDLYEALPSSPAVLWNDDDLSVNVLRHIASGR